MKNYYQIIGVDTNASQETIKNAYLLKVKKYHPDIYTGDKNFALNKTSELNEAFNVLKDEQKRMEYDIKMSILPKKKNARPQNQKVEKSQKQTKTKSVNNKRKNEKDEPNFFQNIILKIKAWIKQVKQDNLERKQEKNKGLTAEQIHIREGKKKLNSLIILTLVIIVFVILILVL